MYILPVSNKQNSITYKAVLKGIPKYSLVTQKQKADYIQEIVFAGIFEEFEKNFRKTMNAFVYMIKR